MDAEELGYFRMTIGVRQLTTSEARDLIDAVESTQSQLAQALEEKRGLDRLLASVPDLVKDAFQEGFRVDGGGLGDAWDASHAKAALNGQANPRPPSWDADKERTQLLEIQLAQAREELERVRASQRSEETMYAALAAWIHRTERSPSQMECFLSGWQDCAALTTNQKEADRG